MARPIAEHESAGPVCTRRSARSGMPDELRLARDLVLTSSGMEV
nr:hypothetical protein [Kibdelosporangium sp. MJ126-NF4]CTQ95450.1 hypothetical protein [Kibdelosporangium sp. MJ126-NF4]